MILSAQTITARALRGELITPFNPRTVVEYPGRPKLSYGLSQAGYDIRIADDLTLLSRGFELAVSLERFNMPNDVLARVADKSTWARQGLAVQNTVIEPGWRGYLTLELTNHSSKDLIIFKGDPIAQIIFELLDHPTDQPYEGKYQDQHARPVPAK